MCSSNAVVVNFIIVHEKKHAWVYTTGEMSIHKQCFVLRHSPHTQMQ